VFAREKTKKTAEARETKEKNRRSATEMDGAFCQHGRSAEASLTV
jgi:hypothetical protein